MKKKKILLFVDWYLPGYKAGGPIKSIAAMVSHLKNEFDFYIITSDTDFGELQPYSTIKADCWIELEQSVKVFYASKEFLNWKNLKHLASSISYDLVYVNSYFSKFFSIFPLLFKRNKTITAPVILAPRGMLGTGALGLKSIKKKLFILFSKMSGIHTNIFWHATAMQEMEEIIAVYGKSAAIFIAPNMQQDETFVRTKAAEKHRGNLKLFFLSRISPKKNLLFALDALLDLEVAQSTIEFTIIGPLEDQAYWKECLSRIEILKAKGIDINYTGAVQNAEIPKLISKYHFLLLPTLNENYGHVIVESMLNGKPVIISDQTPWRNLNTINAGWDIPLSNKKIVTDVLKQCLEMDQDEYTKWSTSTYNYAMEKCNPSETVSLTKEMFYKVLN